MNIYAYRRLRACQTVLSPVLALVALTARIAAGNNGSEPWVSLRTQAATAFARGAYDQAEGFLKSAFQALPSQQSAEAIILWHQFGTLHEAQSRIQDAERDFK